ncbi:MAG: hypothetical protein CVU06_07065 [Bacteroidetes bacterium HGW-Bacteroidetes-22]|nr:MAG: hypothetical protein CVU06_07065 [Bacteroidetes bacterium HGW-Bacteroidetes-22]
MKINFNLLLNNGLRFGAIMGGAQILISIIYYIAGFEFSNLGFVFINFLVMVGLFFLFLFLSNKHLAKQVDSLNYPEGLVNAIITGIIATIIGAIYSYLFNAYFDPEYVKEIMQGVISMVENNPNIPQEQIDKIYEQYDKMTPLSMTIDALKQGAIFSVIIALIVSIFTRKKKDIFAEETVVSEN